MLDCFFLSFSLFVPFFFNYYFFSRGRKSKWSKGGRRAIGNRKVLAQLWLSHAPGCVQHTGV